MKNLLSLPSFIRLVFIFISCSIFSRMQAQPCTGTPVPGNTLTSTNSPCVGMPVNLSLQNTATLGAGITYQWYSSSGAIAGATNDIYNLIFLTSASYWCVVTCTSTMLSGSSTPVALTTSSFINCYCTSAATSSQDEDIFSVTIDGNSTDPLYSFANGCSNTAPGPGSILHRYSSFISLPPLAAIVMGHASTFSIIQDECDGPPYYANRIGIWIDLNHNSSFTDPGENVYLETVSTVGPRTISGNFIVPFVSLPGNTVMRIVCTEFSTPTPCGNYLKGETEDYLVNILPFGVCTGMPNPGLTLSASTIVCAGTPVNLTLQYPTIGAAYQWFNGSGMIVGATNSNYFATLALTDSFYCQVTCISSGISANSTPIILSVNAPSAATSSEFACDTFLWNSNILSSSGTYIDTFTNAVGCDSVHTLNLTLFQSSFTTIVLIACDSTQYNGITYFNSGIYTYPYTNINGCDSIIELDITIHSGSDTIVQHNDCDFFAFNGILYTSTGVYTHTFSDVNGCDSTIHLDLTINQSTDSVINAISCNAITLNGLTYTISGNYNQTLLNASGCDSIILLQATIDTLTSVVTVSGTGLSTPSIGTYQWIDCNGNLPISGATNLNFIPSSGGSYAVVVSTTTCTDTSMCINVWPTQVHNSSINNSAFIFPNPNQGLFTIVLNEPADIYMLNYLGEVVYSKTGVNGTQQFDISLFANGIYVLKLAYKNSNLVYKLIKE
jgi:hypothetical protein